MGNSVNPVQILHSVSSDLGSVLFAQVFLSQFLELAQLDACPTDDQEVAGLTPAGSATFFRGDLIMKYFLRSFSALH